MHYSTSNGTATAGSDYTAASGNISFAAGETSKAVVVAIHNDAVSEADETFTATLTPVAGGAIGSTKTTTVTIRDRDPVPAVRFSSPTYRAKENQGSVVLTVIRSGASSRPVTVQFATSDGTAHAGTDYRARSGKITFAPGGSDQQTFSIPLINDHRPESSESFKVTLTPTASGRVGNPHVATVTIADYDGKPGAQITNISTRVQVGIGEQVGIAGFAISGHTPKKVIVRGIAPSLKAADIGDPLNDPVLELHGPDGSLITRNDNWQDQQAEQIVASGIAPSEASEPAIIATLSPGNYTVVLSDKDGGTGSGLIEVYDLDAAAESQLANISTRGFSGGGASAMIAGFIVEGNSAQGTVIVRALGPTLSDARVADTLLDPTVDLIDANGQRVRSNDNWQDDAVQAAQLIALGLAPAHPKEAGLVVSLPPGAYTAIVSHNGASGIALVEVYHLD